MTSLKLPFLFPERMRRINFSPLQSTEDPPRQSFDVLDVKGVGRLMMIAIEWGRRTKPDLKIGICGEHGGHPESVEFSHSIGLSYVSCSVPRLPIARLAAAHAKLKERIKNLQKNMTQIPALVSFFRSLSRSTLDRDPNPQRQSTHP